MKSTTTPSTNSKLLKSTSHTLSKVLRHKALELGLPITPDGFVPVPSLLECKLFRSCRWETIKEVVLTNDKKRFELRPEFLSPTEIYSEDELVSLIQSSESPKNWKIRAVQGHTMSLISEEELLTEISYNKETNTFSPSEVSPIILHGTYREFLPSILRHGLSRMQRNHIHFANQDPASLLSNISSLSTSTTTGVISGIRKTAEIAIVIDIRAVLAEGVKFYFSKNHVVLCKGLEDTGILPASMFQDIVALDGLPVS